MTEEDEFIKDKEWFDYLDELNEIHKHELTANIHSLVRTYSGGGVESRLYTSPELPKYLAIEILSKHRQIWSPLKGN